MQMIIFLCVVGVLAVGLGVLSLYALGRRLYHDHVL